MPLRKKARTISKDQIRSGQVLEIGYDGDTDLILVIDPKATTVSNTGAKEGGVGQGRMGKLHAVKLREAGLSDDELIELIKEIRSLGRNATPEQIYNKFINSKYKTGGRSYRTYSPDKIAGIMRITVGQDALKTNKITIGNSVLYGMNHGKHIELSIDDYDKFHDQLQSVGGQIFFEGPTGGDDLPIIEEVINSMYVGTIKKASWEPPPEEFAKRGDFGKLGGIGGTVAGWWNQWIRGDDDGGITATANIKSEWAKVDPSFSMTIGEVFGKSMGGNLSSLRSKWKTYNYGGNEYTAEYVFGTLFSQRGWQGGKPTRALEEFNEAGHFQVFPEDSAWDTKTKKFDGNYEEGELFEAQHAFNKIRDEYLIFKMETNPGIYFAGSGHLDNIRKMRK